MNKHILVILADGFEELEATGTIDVLRRLGFPLTVAGLERKSVTGAHGLTLNADALLADCPEADFDAVVLPGGMPGARNLYDAPQVVALVQALAARAAVTAAICAAPIVLARAGVLAGRRFTLYPGFESFLGGLTPEPDLVVSDGPVVTGRGPGATVYFAAAVAAALGCRAQEIRELFRGMLVPEVGAWPLNS